MKITQKILKNNLNNINNNHYKFQIVHITLHMKNNIKIFKMNILRKDHK